MFKLPFLKKQRGLELPVNEVMDIKDIIAPSSIKISSTTIEFGERLAKSFFIFSYPRYLTTGWFSPIVNLDVPIDISFFLHPADTTQILKQLRQKITAVSAELSEREEKGLIRAPELEIAYQDMEDLRERLQTAQERMFHFGLYLTIYADTDKELRDIETTLRSILEGRLIYIKPALHKQKEGFIATSPYGLDLLLIHNPMNTAPLSSCFPFISFDLSSNEGILYGINQHNNSLILFDRFNMENYNSVLFGKAGCGKSLDRNENVLCKYGGKICLTKIGLLIEKIIKKYGATKIDKEMEGVLFPDLKVFTFNKNLKGEWSRVTAAARKEAPEIFYKFTTASGREVTTTEDHNMVFLKDGNVKITKSSEIKKGEFIPLPRKIYTNQFPIKPINLLKLLKNSSQVYIVGAEALIRGNYTKLKRTTLSKKLDRYLYKYKVGRRIPINYFLKILKFLAIKINSPKLENIKVTSRNGKGALQINLPITPGVLRIFGFITAEGTVRNDVIIITNQNLEVLKTIDKALKEINVPFYYGNKGIIIATRVFVEIIKSLQSEAKAGQKRVPPLLFNLNNQQIANYLSAYFEGDGGVEENQVVASSKSKEFISDLSYLLLRFGIVARIKKRFKRATNSNHKGDWYWFLSISGQKNLKIFAEHIGLITKEKNKKLQKILGKKYNTNVDVIPGLAIIFKKIYELFGFQLYGITEISEWKLGKRNPSPEHLKRVIEEIEKRVEDFRGLFSTFESLTKLPELNQIINFGKNNKKLNAELWQELGGSWAVMKNQNFNTLSQNAFKAIKTVYENNYSLVELKQKIHFGFKAMGLPIKHYNPSLQSALVNTEANTRYKTVKQATQYIWQNYQKILNENIPQVEEKLNQLKILANSDLFWDPIVKVEKIKNKNPYVYDLQVDNEVFLAGTGGMFVHNSYAVKLEVLRSLMMGINVIIVDPENEYNFLADATGGSFFNISLASPHHVNPFDLPIPREDENPEDVLRSNIINLVGLMRIMLGGLTPEEDAIMDRALAETYAAKDITNESDPASWPDKVPIMSDLQAVLETMEGADSLVRRIQKFTTGTYASFFNQPSNISMDKKLVIFGIRDMEEELKQMAMFIIMRYIWKTITSELKKRIVVVDEAWWLMQTEDGASFLYGLAKRARKYWLGVTTITQDVNDFMKSDYGQPIVANSSIQILMKQSPATIDIVQQTFNLTDEERLRILEASIGEGLFFAGAKHVAIRVVASYTEDQIITTAPEEVIKIKQAKKELEESAG